MSIDSTKTFLGGVSRIKIDSDYYDIYGPDGATIEPVADIGVKFVCGTPTPRVRVRSQHFVVQCSIPENTLETLQLAWNQTETATVSPWDYFYLGVIQSPTEHTLEINAYDRKETGQIYEEVGPMMQLRHYHFYKCVAYEPQPQELRPDGVVVIPIRFICLADMTKDSGKEFGYVQRPEV